MDWEQPVSECSQNNGLSSSQTVYHSHFHVIPSFGRESAWNARAKKKAAPEAEYKDDRSEAARGLAESRECERSDVSRESERSEVECW